MARPEHLDDLLDWLADRMAYGEPLSPEEREAPIGGLHPDLIVVDDAGPTGEIS